MAEFVPPFNQALLGNPMGRYEMSPPAEAMFDAVINEMARVYWNVNQKQFDSKYGEPDHGIPEITIHRYWWGEPEDPEAERPNFTYDGVEVRWYKYIGRGMSCNVEWDANQWAEWMIRAIKHINNYDTKLF